MNPYAGDSQGPAQKDRSALPQCQPVHRQQVRLGHQREVHARQHAHQRKAARPAQLPSRATSLHLDDSDPVRKRQDRRQSWRNPRLLCLCFTGLRWEDVLGTGAPRLAGAARRGGA